MEYGFFESPKGELQAFAIESKNPICSVIAVSSYLHISLGNFLHCALSFSDILVEFGDPGMERKASELPPGPRLDLRPHDIERRKIVNLLLIMGFRFLTAHELTHIVHGHTQLRMQHNGTASMSEAVHAIVPNQSEDSFTLEMDADSGATLESLGPFLDGAYRWTVGEETAATLAKPQNLLRLWMFAIYTLFRILDDDRHTRRSLTSSHPPPMLRLRMVLLTMEAFLAKRGETVLLDSLSELYRKTFIDVEKAYAYIVGRNNYDLKALTYALSSEGTNRIEAIRMHWANLRDELEPLKTCLGKLAPLPVAGPIQSISGQLTKRKRHLYRHYK